MKEATFAVVSIMTVHQITYTGPIPRVARAEATVREPKRRAGWLWHWSPRGLQDRGLTAGREQQRAYSDLQAAAAASDWR
jgi:hypothetical protein